MELVSNMGVVSSGITLISYLFKDGGFGSEIQIKAHKEAVLVTS
jgi:hypothetical protein